MQLCIRSFVLRRGRSFRRIIGLSLWKSQSTAVIYEDSCDGHSNTYADGNEYHCLSDDTLYVAFHVPFVYRFAVNYILNKYLQLLYRMCVFI